VSYILATSVSHRLITHLTEHGRLKRIQFFHSFVGIEGEYELYTMLYPLTALIGQGLNVVNRAIGLAEWMGYDTIHLAGVDCALGPGDIFHVGETHPETGVILRGKFDGREYATKPDMLVSAIDIVMQKRRLGNRLQLIGDTLPKALQHKDDAFLDRCITWKPPEEEIPASAKGLTTVTDVS
jgi:hypothetical protein